MAKMLMLAVLLFAGLAQAADQEISSESALVLTLGATPAKIAKLMTGANTLKVTRNQVGPEASVYTFVASACSSGVVLQCKETARLQITGQWVNQGELSHVAYSSSEVTLAAGANPQNYKCVAYVDCMPGAGGDGPDYCSADYDQWAKANCANPPGRVY